MQDQHPSKPQPYGKAEYVQVLTRGNQIEVSKFDKEARQDYVLTVPKREYDMYAGQGVPIEKAFPHLSEERQSFLRSHLTPGEQRIKSDPAYQETLNTLMRAPAAAFNIERMAILERANSSQLEPYDYRLSLRHQAFNAALRDRPDLSPSTREIEWIKDISQAQYRSQLSRDPSFNPEMRLGPAADWTKNQLNRQISPDLGSSVAEGNQLPSPFLTPTRSAQPIAAHAALRVSMPSSNSNSNHAASPHAGLSIMRAGLTTNLDSLPDTSKAAELITLSILGPSAKTFAAQTASGVYRGPIIAETQDVVLQRLSACAVVAHSKELFRDQQALKVGTNVSVSYSNAKPLVRHLQSCEKRIEVER